MRVHAKGMSDAGISLGAGERWQWSAPEPEPRTTAPSDTVEAVTPLAPPGPKRAVPSFPEPYRAAVAAGDYARAYSALGAKGFERAVALARDGSTLLALSDVARAAGEPEQAALALARLLDRHPRGEQAGLAALTLGRLELEALGRPRAAVRSLQRAMDVGLAVSCRRMPSRSSCARMRRPVIRHERRQRPNTTFAAIRTDAGERGSRAGRLDDIRAFGALHAAPRGCCVRADGCAGSAVRTATPGNAQARSEPHGAAARDAIVLVSAQPCATAPYDSDALLRSLEVELAAIGLHAQRLPEAPEEAESAVDRGLAVLRFECGDNPLQIRLVASDLASGKESLRELQVADLTSATRGRALALAAVSLLESSLSELLDSTPRLKRTELPEPVEAALRARLVQRLSPAAASPPAAIVAPKTVPSDRVPPLRFDLSALLRAFPGRSTGLLGLRVGVAPALGTGLRWIVDAEAAYGQSDLADAAGTIGRMHMYWFTAGLGPAWSTRGDAALELGPRVLFGYALADADIERAGATRSSDGGFVLSVVLAADARFAFWNALERRLEWTWAGRQSVASISAIRRACRALPTRP